MNRLKCYYINLDNRPDRRAFMEAQFARLGIEAQRVAAVTRQEAGDRASAVSRKAISRHQFSLSELACNLSHQTAWTAAFSGNAEHALILEDDAVLGPDFAGAANAVAQVAHQFDIIRLETRLRRSFLDARACAVAGRYELFRFHRFEWGMAACIVSRKAANQTVACGQLDLTIIDKLLFNPRYLRWHRLNIVQICPAPVFHPGMRGLTGVQTSDLTQDRHSNKAHRNSSAIARATHFFANKPADITRTLFNNSCCLVGLRRNTTIAFTGHRKGPGDDAG